MKETARQVTPAINLNPYHLSVDSNRMAVTVFWARVVSSETESLLTSYTKHTFFEVQYALEGRIVMTVDDQRPVTLDESDFIVIPPDTYHQIVDGDDTGARFIMAFSITDKTGEGLRQQLTENVHPHRESPALRALLTLILQKGQARAPSAASMLSPLIETFLLELCQITAPQATERKERDAALREEEKRVATILRFVREDHGVGVTVTDIARRFGISERHLNRIFRAETGSTLRDAINHEKLRHIEELVASTICHWGRSLPFAIFRMNTP